MRDLLRAQPHDGRFRMADVDAASTPGLKSPKQLKRDLKKYKGKLFNLQERLYAEKKRSVLLVLQGMDTSGKDGTITHVIGNMNPEGVLITTFKQPTPEERRIAQESLDISSCPLALQALQHLAQHQVSNDNLVGAEYRAQALDVGCLAAIEEVDPDAAVDNDQAVPRPLRLRARLPRQRYLPKAAPASCCRRNLIIKRSACSTVCFLVACPEAFWASAISVSSISILVRIGNALLCV